MPGATEQKHWSDEAEADANSSMSADEPAGAVHKCKDWEPLAEIPELPDWGPKADVPVAPDWGPAADVPEPTEWQCMARLAGESPEQEEGGEEEVTGEDAPSEEAESGEQ